MKKTPPKSRRHPSESDCRAQSPKTGFFDSVKNGVIAIVVLVGIHLFIFEAGVGGADGWSYLMNLESLVNDGDLDGANNRQPLPESYRAEPYMRTGICLACGRRRILKKTDKEGVYECATCSSQAIQKPVRYVTHEPLGAAFFDAPFYMAGLALSKFVKVDLRPKREPYTSLPPETMIKVLSVVASHNVYAILAIILIYLTLLELKFDAKHALAAALFSFFGGPLHWYATCGLCHAVSTFSIALLMYVFVRTLTRSSALEEQSERARPQSNDIDDAPRAEDTDRASAKRENTMVFLIGALIGLSSVVRYINGIVLFSFCFVFLLKDYWNVKTALKNQILLGLGCASTAWITFAYWKIQFGGYFTNPHAKSGAFSLTLFPPPTSKVLFSAYHGFFTFNPVFLLALVGSVMIFWRRRKDHPALFMSALVALLSLLSMAAIYDSYEEWQGVGTYSSRFLTNCIVFMSIGLCYFLSGKSGGLLRYCAAIVLTLFSYSLFLLTKARLISSVEQDPYSVGKDLSDYLYVLKEGILPGEIFSRVLDSSYTLKFLANRPAGLLILIVFLGMAIFILWGVTRKIHRQMQTRCERV